MLRAIASIATVTALVCAFLWLVYTTPAPYSDEHRAFTSKDQRLLEADYPGGVFQSARLYIWCAPKDKTWGELVFIHSDGRVIWQRQTCWRWPRE